YVTSLALDEIAEHNRQLTAQLIDGLTQRGANLLTPRDPKRRAGTVTARFPRRHGGAGAPELPPRGGVVSPRGGPPPFSLHFSNTSDDGGRALAALDGVLR